MRTYLMALGATAFLALSGCAQTTPDINFPEPDFTLQSPLRMNVGAVDVVDDYQPQGDNHVENKFPNPINKMIRKWARQRVQAAGGPNRLEVIIDEARATEVALPRKTGIEGTFTKEPASKVETAAKVTLKLYTPEKALPMAQATAQANVSRSLQEDTSPYDRQKAYNDMTLDLMQRLDRELENQVNGYFGRYKSF